VILLPALAGYSLSSFRSPGLGVHHSTTSKMALVVKVSVDDLGDVGVERPLSALSLVGPAGGDRLTGVFASHGHSTLDRSTVALPGEPRIPAQIRTPFRSCHGQAEHGTPSVRTADDSTRGNAERHQYRIVL